VNFGIVSLSSGTEKDVFPVLLPSVREGRGTSSFRLEEGVVLHLSDREGFGTSFFRWRMTQERYFFLQLEKGVEHLPFRWRRVLYCISSFGEKRAWYLFLQEKNERVPVLLPAGN
jgi:hypothetical protein